MADKIIKTLEAEDIEIREINEKTRTIWHKITKEVKDRMGDIVRIDGIDTKNFRKKPTVLYGHNYSSMDPIAVIGKNIGFRKEGKSLYAGTRFLNPEEEKLSDKLTDLVNDSWTLTKMKLMGWSIGFIPLETEGIKEDEKQEDECIGCRGRDFKKCELLEYSVVLIPANQEAVNDAIARGIISKAVMPEIPARVEPEPEKPKEETKLVDELMADIEDKESVQENQIELPKVDDPGAEPVEDKKAAPIPEIPKGGANQKVSPKSYGGKTRMNPKLLELINKLRTGVKLTDEESAEFDTLFAENKEQKAEPNRRIEFTDEKKGDVRSINAIMETPSRLLTPVEQELQSRMDDFYIVSSLLNAQSIHSGGGPINPRQLKMWTDLRQGTSALRKAMDTATATEGLEWIPTTLSAQLIEKYRLEARVAALFDEIAMPRNPYVLPTELGDMTFYLMPESLTAEPSKTPTTKLTTGNKTLTSKKLRARSIWSEELDANSIIPVLPRIKDVIAKSAALAVEDVILNGDTTAPHQDSDVTDSKDHRKSWKGLRKLCLAGAKADLGTFDKDTTRGLLTLMGKYGITPSEIAWIAGIKDFNNLRGLAELLTVDKYGPAATILTGEVGKFYGSPVIVSEKIRETLNATGVYDGSTTDNTILIAVNRRAWIIGNDGGWKLTVDFDNDVDQYILNVRFRKDFIPIYDATTEKIVALGYNVTV